MCHPFEYVVAVRRTQGAVGSDGREHGRPRRARHQRRVRRRHRLPVGGAPAERDHRRAAGQGPTTGRSSIPKHPRCATPLYAGNCTACHGADARGTPQGRISCDRWSCCAIVTAARSVRSCAASHPPVPLPGKGGAPAAVAFEGLTSREVLLLAHFLRDRVNDTLRGAPMFKPGNVLTGDPKAGAEYFNGEGGCTQCHSPTGDLAGIGRRARARQPAAALPVPAYARGGQGPDAKVVTVTVTTESGQTLAGELDRMDDFNVSLRDAVGHLPQRPADAGHARRQERIRSRPTSRCCRASRTRTSTTSWRISRPEMIET